MGRVPGESIVVGRGVAGGLLSPQAAPMLLLDELSSEGSCDTVGYIPEAVGTTILRADAVSTLSRIKATR